LRSQVLRLDGWVWGHGMIRPVPGFLWGPQRRAALAPDPPVYFAHSDMSGLSLFEEAFYRGRLAGAAAAQRLGRP
jgi:hypothetical protein